MINWNEMKSLHVVAKLEQILNRWYGVELFWADARNRIQSGHMEKGHEFKNQFFKVQMEMAVGQEFLTSDIEKATEYFQSNSDKRSYIYESFFGHVNVIASKVEIDGEFLGTVFAFPFVSAKLTKEEEKTIINKMIECGTSEEDAVKSVASLRRLDDTQVEYLEELIELVSTEVIDFHGQITQREQRIKELNSKLGDKYRYHMMIGKSKKMQVIYRLLDKISTSESSVFVQGENGTGKELVAKAIHFYSPRKDSMFLALNCSAFNDNLLDSELFGHVKGAFTGAMKDKKGLFEQANGGTLFLDEIGDTSLSMQVKLLRVLQEGTYLPVGATSPRKCDVRIIAATNKPIKQMMKDGEFREDLYYRINVINVDLPALRDRNDDVPLLMDHFLKKRCDEVGHAMKSFTKKCLEKMLDYPWPGNVRELENEIERLVVLAGDDKMIGHESLSQRILDHEGSVPRISSGSSSGGGLGGIDTDGTLKQALEQVEVLMIGEGLKRCNFNKSKLAKELGVSRASLIMKVDKYDLDKRKKAAGE